MLHFVQTTRFYPNNFEKLGFKKINDDLFMYHEDKLILASSDPCDLAVNYGRVWTALGNLMPQLDRLFVIKKRDVEALCDFTASETTVIARVDITITLSRLPFGLNKSLHSFHSIQTAFQARS